MHPVNIIQKKITLFFSAFATLGTATQFSLQMLNKPTICFNEGCSIVETYTAIPPSSFNLFGMLFFAILFWTAYLSRENNDFWSKMHNILLLAGLAAEGVLVGFQHFILHTYCTYCLIVFSFIVFLNLLRGARHFTTGVAIFAAVLIGFFSLSFPTGAATEKLDLKKGAIGSQVTDPNEAQLTFFFSSTCMHCKEIMENLEAPLECNITFNPIDEVEQFNVAGIIKNETYDPAINRAFLAQYSIDEIPVLFVKEHGSFSVITQKSLILEKIEEPCSPDSTYMSETLQNESTSNELFLPPTEDDDGHCSVEEDCVDIPESQQ